MAELRSRGPAPRVMKGVVTWFSWSLGYGFIRPEGGGRDIFCHFSGIDADGYRMLQRDQRVIFDIADGEKGPIAVNVRVMS